ncbi:MAG: hypothetical protein ACE5LB_18590, partial [Acidiferrobacterales bacterium]
ALQYHRTGSVQQVGVIYKQILPAQPEHSDASHLLGAVVHPGANLEPKKGGLVVHDLPRGSCSDRH